MISRVFTSGVPGLGTPFPAELGIFLTAAILVVVALVLASGRGTADPEHVAPVARYFGAIIVLTSFVALFAAFSMVFSLTDLVVDHSERSAQVRREQNSEEGFVDAYSSIDLPVSETQFDFSAERNNDANYSAAVASGLVALTAAAVALFHLRARRRLDPDSAVVERVDRAARLGVCFVTALTVAIAVTSVGFGIFEIVAPGVAIGGVTDVGRAEGVSEALSFGFLAILAGIGFRRSWQRVFPKPSAEAVTTPAT
jgi:hypothetical protein